MTLGPNVEPLISKQMSPKTKWKTGCVKSMSFKDMISTEILKNLVEVASIFSSMKIKPKQVCIKIHKTMLILTSAI